MNRDTDLLDRLARIIAERGEDTTPGPVDDAPSPDQPGHPEYHRRQRVQAALARFDAAAPPRYRGVECDHPAVAVWADQVATDPTRATSLLLWGGTGSGKTHLAYAAARHVALAGPSRFAFIAWTMPDLYAALRPGAGDAADRERVMRRATTAPLLLLDDLGTARESAWTEEITYRLINHRYNHQLPTVITTNRSPADLPDMVGDRVASRVIGMTTRIHITGADRRLS